MKQRIKPLKKEVVAQEEVSKRVKEERKPVFLGDIESMMSVVVNQVPLMNNDTLLFTEIDLQNKIYGAVMLMGTVMLLFALLI